MKKRIGKSLNDIFGDRAEPFALEHAMKLFASGSLKRWSSVANAMPPALRAEAERERRIAARCDVHGELSDPVIGITGTTSKDRVVYICPQCSAPEILAWWESQKP